VADANFDGDVDDEDYQIWRAAYGSVRQPLTPGGGGFAQGPAIPEPATLMYAALVGSTSLILRTRRFLPD
jgi:hypothetical protein